MLPVSQAVFTSTVCKLAHSSKRRNSFCLNDAATAHNTANHDTLFFEKDYCGRSMPFAAKKNAARRGLCTRYAPCHSREMKSNEN